MRSAASTETRSPRTVDAADRPAEVRGLPRWPLAALFAGFPLWWALGLGEFVWPLAAVVMVVELMTVRRVSLPRRFAVWFLFVAWVVASLSQVDTLGRMAGAIYRLAMYASALVIFLYVYNARRRVSRRYLLGLLTAFFAWMVLGGYLGLVAPTGSLRTPLAYVLPQGLLSNDLVHQMVIRPFTQYNPDAWVVIEPRPSAPFLYTNNWGNAYSLLLPLVLLYLLEVRGTRRFWAVLALVPVSMVPAFLTLNRGMFLGLGLAAVYSAVRLAALGHRRALAGLGAMLVAGALAVTVLPVVGRLESRLAESGTNASRASIYWESIRQAAASPLLGYGAPRPAADLSPYSPSLGTQGQIWMVLFSNGFVGVALFVAGLAWLVLATVRLRDTAGVVFNAVLLVLLVETFYYGVLGAGLGIAMAVAALALRPNPQPEPSGGVPSG